MSHNHDCTIREEFIHHLPYSILSVAFSLSLVTILYGLGGLYGLQTAVPFKVYYLLFHNFHFLHIIFAVTGSLVMFFRYSRKWWFGIIVSVISSSFFCILSDIALPYVGGRLLGASMKGHICFFDDATNISIFLIIGIVNGLAKQYCSCDQKGGRDDIVFIHVLHVVVSSLASTFYLVAHGFELENSQLGYVFLLLMVAVMLPCTLSDICVPMLFAKRCRVRR